MSRVITLRLTDEEYSFLKSMSDSQAKRLNKNPDKYFSVYIRHIILWDFFKE